eukprot:TRINITY_DN1663_c0_g1_i1.p1 TRINITY_DN1663_c0_g1~~TRINITY_DN1663_c0_g1_i1.p1  ORF type:complete len:197 (+),score=34.54 TRINITY_DN1663_c0_g1_i1:116-706(+)
MFIPESVQLLLVEGKFDELAQKLDEVELQTDNIQQWPVGLHVLAYLYVGSAENARFVYKRATKKLKESDKISQPAFKVLQSVWNREWGLFWQVLSQTDWSAPVVPLIEALTSKYRQNLIQLTQRTYTNISRQQLGEMLGLSPDEAVAMALSLGGCRLEGEFVIMEAVVEETTYEANMQDVIDIVSIVSAMEAQQQQ